MLTKNWMKIVKFKGIVRILKKSKMVDVYMVSMATDMEEGENYDATASSIPTLVY